MKTLGARLLFALALLLLLSLGVWQLNRGWQKSHIVSQLASPSQDYQMLEKIPTDFTALEYRSVSLQGQWQNEQVFLLANRIYQQQLGYEVFTAFRLTSGQLLLINRGWIALNQAKTLRAATNPPQGILYAPKKGYTLGEAITDYSNQWPKVSLYWDNAAFNQVLGEPILPLVLVLDQQHPASFTRIWQPVVVTPERHYAYAMQWFGLALVLVIFGFIWQRKASNE